MQSTKEIWDKWELLAIDYLKKKGYILKTTNYKFWRFWEIDLIVEKDTKTYFVEVKYRNNKLFWEVEESITKSKLRKLEKSIYSYCMKNWINIENIAFDVITISKGEKSYKLKHYKNLEF